MSKPRPVIECKYGCGQLLQDFDEQANKYLEYPENRILHTPERCKFIKPRKGQVERFAPPTPAATIPAAVHHEQNPIQRAVEQPHQSREEQIVEAQRIRKEENDALINAIKGLTVEIIELKHELQKQRYGPDV